MKDLAPCITTTAIWLSVAIMSFKADVGFVVFWAAVATFFVWLFS